MYDQTLNLDSKKYLIINFSVQGDNSLEVITVPIKFLLPLAEYIKSKEGKDPDIAIMWNPGRCGSTLLSQMMEPIPDLVTMSEPDFITADIRKREFQTYSQFDLDKDPFLYGKFLLACLIIQCKGMFHKSVVIKPRSMALTNLKYLKGNCRKRNHFQCYIYFPVIKT